MSVQSITSITSRALKDAIAFVQGQARIHSHAETVAYLKGMPSHLRRDIGLLDDADLVAAVERGLPRETVNNDTRRDLTMAPHAA